MKHRSAVLSALAGVALGAPLAASAQDSGGDRRFYIAPMFSYVAEDGHRGLGGGVGGTLAIGKKLTSGLNLELIGYYDTAKPDRGGGDKATFYGVGAGLMVFPFSSVSSFYVPLSVYSNWGKNQYGIVKDYRSTVFDSGIGLLLPLVTSPNHFIPDGTSVRIEARYRYDQHGEPELGKGGKDSAYDGVFNIGLLIPFTHSAQPVAETPPPAAEVVPPVEAPPAEAPAPEAAPAPEPAPTPAAPPAECRPPEPGEMVTLEGCAVGGGAAVLKGVTFETNTAMLRPDAKTVLDGVADKLQASPGMTVEIAGYTDNVGSNAHNRDLSERRAISVKAYLASKGVAGNRMTAKGYGEGSPVASNDAAEGREQNRRVELHVTSGGTPAEGHAAAPPSSAPAEAPAPAAPAAESAPPPDQAPAAAPADAGTPAPADSGSTPPQ